MSGKVEELKEKNFRETIKKGPALIDFAAPWCQGCKLIEPYLNDLAKEWNDDIKFYKIDVTKNPGLAARLAVMSLPNILIFKNGKVIDQIIGATNKRAIESAIKKALK